MPFGNSNLKWRDWFHAGSDVNYGQRLALTFSWQASTGAFFVKSPNDRCAPLKFDIAGREQPLFSTGHLLGEKERIARPARLRRMSGALPCLILLFASTFAFQLRFVLSNERPNLG
jgi:hypothetical protein